MGKALASLCVASLSAITSLTLYFGDISTEVVVENVINSIKSSTKRTEPW